MDGTDSGSVPVNAYPGGEVMGLSSHVSNGAGEDRQISAMGLAPRTDTVGAADMEVPRTSASGHVDGACLQPSPLPSPVSATNALQRTAEAARVSRAAMWFSRLGEFFQQRRVEVHTAWSPMQENPWLRPRTTGYNNSSGHAEGQAIFQPPTPPSSGSAGVPQELVQAEVAKPLDGAMSELYSGMMGKIQDERRRTEEAMDEARQLRHQLERMEERMAARSMATMAKAQQGVPQNHPTPGPPPGITSNAGGMLQQFQDYTAGDRQSLSAAPLLLPGVSSVRPNVAEAQPGVSQNHPTPGPGPNFSVQSNPSVPPSRSFLQGLFGLGAPRSPSPEPANQQQSQQKDSAQQPGRVPGSSNDQVLTAMARGIESPLQNQHNKSERPETVKPGISELPQLPAYTPTTGSIDLLNWLTHITPIMEDLSDTSSHWWTMTLKDVSEWYARFSVSTPLEKVRLRPVVSTMGKPEWSRVKRRATAMVLGAIPAQVKEEAIATGDVHTVGLLCKLFATYQPGNRQEKTLVLTSLEHPQECETALEAVDALRKWSLWRRRAQAIGIAEPDPSVLLQGLDRITAVVVKSDPELSFRVSLVRSNLQVDVCPTPSSITSFSQHLQAEMEQQARLGVSRNNDTAPRLKALVAPSEAASSTTPYNPATPTSPTPKGVCKFFAGDKGCQRGNTCRYPHTWTSLEKGERARRCLACGSTTHKVRECRAPGGGSAKGKGKGEKGEVTSATAPTTSTSAATPRKVSIEEKPEVFVKVMKLWDEIKNMGVIKPTLRTLFGGDGQWISPTQSPRAALMDSGATHALRPPLDQMEWEQASQVNVASQAMPAQS